ncbi:MAG: hypothetical protein KC731_09240 [Myxococcales bacterium]|nr:hypothetical protein [Myxococcales bacterium]
MKRLIPFVVYLALLSGLFLLASSDSEVVWGMPVACIEGGPCWIAAGGTGVIVLGAGVGVIGFGFITGGLLFATGQVTGGAICLGQLAIGVTAFLGQVGTGLVGAGQGALGLYTVSQGNTTGPGRRFLDGLSRDLDELLALRPGRDA